MLHNLEILSLNNYNSEQYNKFTALPAFVYCLKNLKQLDMSRNKLLKHITKDIIGMINLESLVCDACPALEFPPNAVCEQGLTAIKKYLTDLEKGSVVELTIVPVAVLGNSMSGKTSLVQSLKAGERRLTNRKSTAPTDEATRVFKVETLEANGVEFKFIDYGGHDAYHIAYQLANKDNCIPVFVVDIAAFDALASKREGREAARRLCFDWMSHCYLSSPNLKSPILVLTHSDKLELKMCIQRQNELQNMCGKERDSMLKQETKKKHSKASFTKSGQISEKDQIHMLAKAERNANVLIAGHLADQSNPVFSEDDIYVLNGTLGANDNLNKLMQNLNKRSREFRAKVPALWHQMTTFIDNYKEKPYLSLSEIKERFPGEQQEIILRYMHNSGKVLWFEKAEQLSEYIFHNIEQLTDMIALLFHHKADMRWLQRVEEFVPDDLMSANLYQFLVTKFKRTGLLDEVVLLDILHTESKFPPQLALSLLTTFLIVHGPITADGRKLYIIPSLSQSYADRLHTRKRGHPVIKTDLLFRGLGLPSYAYDLVTVSFLNMTSKPKCPPKVYQNGATAKHGNTTIHLRHDSWKNQVTLEIFSPVRQLDKAWESNMIIVRSIEDRMKRVWKAARLDVKSYCGRCAYIQTPDPDFDLNPSWIEEDFDFSLLRDVEVLSCERVLDSARDEKEADVPTSLMWPCKFDMRVKEKCLLYILFT